MNANETIPYCTFPRGSSPCAISLRVLTCTSKPYIHTETRLRGRQHTHTRARAHTQRERQRSNYSSKTSKPHIHHLDTCTIPLVTPREGEGRFKYDSNARTHARRHARTHAHTHTHTHTRTHTHTHARTHAPSHTYTHSHPPEHTHLCVHSQTITPVSGPTTQKPKGVCPLFPVARGQAASATHLRRN